MFLRDLGLDDIEDIDPELSEIDINHSVKKLITNSLILMMSIDLCQRQFQLSSNVKEILNLFVVSKILVTKYDVLKENLIDKVLVKD